MTSMSRYLLRTGAIIASVACVGAQQAHSEWNPKISSVDLAATYTAERAKIASSNCGCFFLNGGSLEGAVTLYRGIGIATNFTGVYANNISPDTNLGKVVFMAGPRYTMDTSHWTNKFTGKHATKVFSEALFGGAHAFDGVFPTSNGTKEGASSFALQIGGGADVALAKGFGLRVIEVDYVHTSLPNNGSNSQNDLRVALGVSYHIGKR